MKAILRSARIAPKKANVIARVVRGMSVAEAQDFLGRTHKKAARLFEDLLASAVANASHNDQQNSQVLLVKEVIVNQGSSLRRGVPMARGRVRPMRKFLSHISIRLGLRTEDGGPRNSDGGRRRLEAMKNDTVSKKSPAGKKKSPKSDVLVPNP